VAAWTGLLGNLPCPAQVMLAESTARNRRQRLGPPLPHPASPPAMRACSWLNRRPMLRDALTFLPPVADSDGTLPNSSMAMQIIASCELVDLGVVVGLVAWPSLVASAFRVGFGARMLNSRCPLCPSCIRSTLKAVVQPRQRPAWRVVSGTFTGQGYARGARVAWRGGAWRGGAGRGAAC
jgi:hypothetical protein